MNIILWLNISCVFFLEFPWGGILPYSVVIETTKPLINFIHWIVKENHSDQIYLDYWDAVLSSFWKTKISWNY